jgi:hypothetical protein
LYASVISIFKLHQKRPLYAGFGYWPQIYQYIEVIALFKIQHAISGVEANYATVLVPWFATIIWPAVAPPLVLLTPPPVSLTCSCCCCCHGLAAAIATCCCCSGSKHLLLLLLLLLLKKCPPAAAPPLAWPFAAAAAAGATTIPSEAVSE